MDFNSAIASCSAAVLVQRAEQIFSGMQEVQIKPSLVTYNTVISVYQKSSLSDKALGMLQEMEAAQVVPDLISYSSAISACEKGRMVNKAFQMFDQMRVKRITPNLISYSALISACEKCSCATDAGEALSQLIVDRLQPDVISFNAAIRAFAKVGDVTSAKDLFWKMKQHNVQPNVVSLNSLLSAYDTPGKDIHDIGSETLRLMEEMAAQRIRANVVTFSTLINAYEKHSLWELALTDLAQMRMQRTLLPIRLPTLQRWVHVGDLAIPFWHLNSTTVWSEIRWRWMWLRTTPSLPFAIATRPAGDTCGGLASGYCRTCGPVSFSQTFFHSTAYWRFVEVLVRVPQRKCFTSSYESRNSKLMLLRSMPSLKRWKWFQHQQIYSFCIACARLGIYILGFTGFYQSLIQKSDEWHLQNREHSSSIRNCCAGSFHAF